MGSTPFVSLEYQVHPAFGTPQTLTIFNNSSLNICIQIFFWTYFSFLLYTYLGVQLLGHMVTLSHLLKNFPACFPTWPHCFTSPPAVLWRLVSPCPHCCSIICPFVCRHSSGCGVVSHVLLICISLTANPPLAITTVEISTQWKRQIMSLGNYKSSFDSKEPLKRTLGPQDSSHSLSWQSMRCVLALHSSLLGQAAGPPSPMKWVSGGSEWQPGSSRWWWWTCPGQPSVYIEALLYNVSVREHRQKETLPQYDYVVTWDGPFKFTVIIFPEC